MEAEPKDKNLPRFKKNLENNLLCPRLVSIVTPVLNDIKYLEESIKNVLDQSYPFIEHLFVDGGSTDGTFEVLSEYQAKYPNKIRFISEIDNGVGEALNKGLKMAKGEIIGWQDSDDLYLPDAIKTVVGIFEANPDVYYIFGGCDVIDSDGKMIGTLPIKDYNFKKIVRGEHYFSLTSAFFRREVVEAVGYFNPVGNDLDYWIRIAQNFKMFRVDEKLCAWRVHSKSVGFSSGKRSTGMIREKLYQDYLLCRQYGGKATIMAPRVWKYFVYVVLNWLGIFRFINVNIRLRLRKYRPIEYILRFFAV